MECIKEEPEEFRSGIIDAFEAYTRTRHAQDAIYEEELKMLNDLIMRRIDEGLMYMYVDGNLSPRIRKTLIQSGYKLYMPTDSDQGNDAKYPRIVWDHEGMYIPKEHNNC